MRRTILNPRPNRDVNPNCLTSWPIKVTVVYTRMIVLIRDGEVKSASHRTTLIYRKRDNDDVQCAQDEDATFVIRTIKLRLPFLSITSHL